MKILITGSNGQLGSELIKQMSKSDKCYDIIKTDIHNLDITNQSDVFDFLQAERPNMIVNCAAFTNVDRCEEDELSAFRVNAIGAQNLAIGGYKIGAGIVQVSTDYVFDGIAAVPRREFDAINPQSCYGQSKALGEALVKETNPRHFIVRTAWLYGNGINFVKTMMKLAKDRKEINVVSDQVGSPTSTADLARCIINLVDTENYGTYHATGEGSCSWYDFSKKIFELKKVDIQVNPINTEQLNRPANRPKYSVLDNYMLKLLGLNTFRHWEEALEEYLTKEELA